MQATAVPVRRAVIGPARAARVIVLGGISQDFLHVTVTQIGVGIVHERDNATEDRRRGGSPGKTGVIVRTKTIAAGAVGGFHAHTRRCHQQVGTGRAERGKGAVRVGRAHGDHIR